MLRYCRSSCPLDLLFVVRISHFGSATESPCYTRRWVGVLTGQSAQLGRTRALPREHFHPETCYDRPSPVGNQKEGRDSWTALFFDFGRSRLRSRLYPLA